MSVQALIALELVMGVAATSAWIGAGVLAATRRAGAATALLALAVAASLARAGLTAALASAGWWFVQEKMTLTLPLLIVTGLTAVMMAGPRLLSARRDDSPPAPRVVVPLFGAGYAAAAGPAVTLLAGYPAMWSTGLITVALVTAAILVTWRVVSTSPDMGSGGPFSAQRPHARRRAVTAVTAAVVVAGALGVALVLVPADSVDTGGGPAGGDHAHQALPVTALRGPSTPGAGEAVRRFTLTARTATVRLSSGREVAAWTFDGRVPGPPVTATQGDLLEVRLRNADIAAGVTLHWHGYDVPSGEDGVPGLTQEAVMPGQEFVYRFRAAQAGTYWYHTHEVSDRGVRMGLYGTFVVTPRPSDDVDLTLPVHTFAGVSTLGDQDQPFERRVRSGAPVRLRLINTDDTPHVFTLNGTPFRVAAIDGRDLNGPGDLSRVRLRLPAGGRYDLMFTMPPGEAKLLVDGHAGTLRLVPDGSGTSSASTGAGMSRTSQALEEPAASVTSEGSGAAGGEDGSGWPEFDPATYGAPATTPFGAGSRFDRRFTLVLDRGFALSGGRPMYAHTVNGMASPSIPAQLVREGDLVRVTVVNRGGETHPWHLHGHTVLVLARDGRAPTGSPLWLDTFDVRPGEVWEVAFRAGNPGMWMNHCHNLGHADLGMALHLAYEGVSTPFHGAHGG